MARQRLYYKTYPVSTRVDPRGVYYGLIQGTTTEPETSLREIMAYKKITAFDPAQVVRLVEDIVQGGLELTSMDGRPRAISSMLKIYLGFDSSFPAADARVTSQKLLANVRLLKDLRVPVDMDNFTLINTLEPTGVVLDAVQIYQGLPPSEAGDIFPINLNTEPYSVLLVGSNLDQVNQFDLVVSRLDDPSVTFTETITSLSTNFYTAAGTFTRETSFPTQEGAIVTVEAKDITGAVLATRTFIQAAE